MKIAVLALLLPTAGFACNNANPQLFVSNLQLAPFIRPGMRPPPPPDGSTARPFRTLKDAIDAAQKSNYCQIRIRLDAGQYDGNVAVSRSLEILGKDRTQSRIKGGVFSTAGMLKLWDLGFVGATVRAISQKNGEINMNRVTVTGYQFAKSFVAARPAAVELSNSKGLVVGLDVKGGEQPALLVEGGGSRVKIFGAGISGNRTSPHAEQGGELVKFAGAVEIANGALANLMVSNVKGNQFVGVLVRDQARLLVNSSAIEGTAASTGFATNVGPDGVILSNGAVVEIKSSSIKANARAGVLSLNSWITMRATAVQNNKFGFVNRDGATDGKDHYDSYKCATLEGTSLTQNETNYVPGSNLPIPNDPLPLPCLPGQPCETPAPPAPPVLSCKSVQLL